MTPVGQDLQKVVVWHMDGFMVTNSVKRYYYYLCPLKVNGGYAFTVCLAV